MLTNGNTTSIKCGKCGSLYFNDGDICGKCGTIWHPENYKPYSKRSCDSKKNFEGIKPKTPTRKGERGTCSNCQRSDMFLLSGKCGTCWRMIRGVPKGPEYDYRLKVTRERLNPRKFARVE